MSAVKKLPALVLFNSPLECGLRATVLLAATFPETLDMQRLIQYDYLMVHSADVNGPGSLHPAGPHRSGELLVKRPLVEAGVNLMMRKSIIACSFTPKGIHYGAGDWALTFLAGLTQEYVVQLRARADWVVREFSRLSDEQLRNFMRERWQNWGSEFEFQALMEESEL